MTLEKLLLILITLMILFFVLSTVADLFYFKISLRESFKKNNALAVFIVLALQLEAEKLKILVSFVCVVLILKSIIVPIHNKLKER